MMSSYDHTLQALQVRLENLVNDRLEYEDELAYAKQAPYGTTSDTLEAVADNEAALEDVNSDIESVQEEIKDLING